ncbi:MAG TPA: hypothetical protein VLJ58_16950 [Ramlibacter sp.]|nr:hypothetical protein [Ramlibacter sp.]
MLTAQQAHNRFVTNQAAEAERHAYNAAFEELGLAWHWDTATYARLPARGRDAVRAYVETEQAHLLRAYDAEFLVEAVETAKARCQATGGDPRHPGHAARADQHRLAA